MMLLAGLLTVLLIAAGLCFGGWILMLLLGALASLTGWSTAIGFWACVVIAGIIGLFFPSTKRN